MLNSGFAISMLYPVMKTFSNKGMDFDSFCGQIGFDRSLLDDVEARIGGDEFERMMRAAAQYTDDDYFGLRQGALTDFFDLGVLGYVMMHSPKVIDALRAYQRYNVILCSGYNLDWEVHGERLLLRMYGVNSPRASRHCIEDMASSLYTLLIRMTNRNIPLHKVRFIHDGPQDTAPYIPVFGVVPQFGCDENAFVVDAEVLQYPILYSDERLRRVFEPIADEIRNRLLGGREWSDQVFQWMMTSMPLSFPSLQETADRFKMSVRSLQTKLQEEGTSFHDIASRVRKEWAIVYLRKKDYSISEIAYLLHYSEPSAFHSAFKKWTGTTPRQYRDRALNETQQIGQAKPARLSQSV